jgi:O-antigen biosynthesis protein
VGQAARDDVGTVGPLLLYADGTVQHAGVVVGYGGQADHVYSGFPPDVEGSVFVSPLLQRNVLANTGACLATSKKMIEKIGGFDEDLSVIGSDIEICLRMHGQGLLNVYDPSVKLYHYESKTRASQPPYQDLLVAGKIYEKFMREGDPFFNRNVSLASKFPLPDVFGSR